MRRPLPSSRSNYSTASQSDAGYRTHRTNASAVDDFFKQGLVEQKTHEQRKQEKFMADFYYKQNQKL